MFYLMRAMQKGAAGIEDVKTEHVVIETSPEGWHDVRFFNSHIFYLLSSMFYGGFYAEIAE